MRISQVEPLGAKVTVAITYLDIFLVPVCHSLGFYRSLDVH